MRDPKRFKKLCQLLEKAWSHYSDQRLGQFLLNYVFGSYGKDLHIYHKEDDEIIAILEKFLQSEKNEVEKFDEGKLFLKMLNKEWGDDPNYWSPDVWIDELIEILLHLEEGIKFRIDELSFVRNGKQDWDEALYYLEKIELIKNTKERFSIDQKDEENDYRLYKFICEKAPSIEIIDEHSYVVIDSPFYKALNDGQKALLYMSYNLEIKYPYRDIKVPKRFKTPEFYDYLNIYYYNSLGPSYFSLSEKGIDMLVKLNTIISDLCNTTKDLSVVDAIREVQA